MLFFLLVDSFLGAANICLTDMFGFLLFRRAFSCKVTMLAFFYYSLFMLKKLMDMLLHHVFLLVLASNDSMNSSCKNIILESMSCLFAINNEPCHPTNTIAKQFVL